MSRMIQANGSITSQSAMTASSSSPVLSSNGGHGIPLGRANVSQIARSIDVAAVKALE